MVFNPATEGDTGAPLRIASAVGSVALDLSRLPMPQTIAAAYAVCACDNGRVYLMPGAAPCTPFDAEYGSSPCFT